MNRHWSGIVFAVLLGNAIPTFATERDTPAEVVDAFHRALLAGDADAALNKLDPAALIFESGYVEADREAYASSHLGADMSFASTTSRKLINRQLIATDDLAVVATESRIQGEFGGKLVDLTSLGTVVLTPTPTGWLIRHIHWSSRKMHGL